MHKRLVLPIDPRATQWTAPGYRWGSFRPHGKIQVVGSAERLDVRSNPAAWDDARSDDPDAGWAARLFVGLNVGDLPKWTVDDVVRVVVEVREAQTGDPSSSFVVQRGVYRHKTSGKTVEEDSVQVIILNLGGSGGPATAAAFKANLIELGEELAARLEQEEVVVELQRFGLSERVMGVTAP